MKKRLPIGERDTETLRKELRSAAYSPLFLVVFVIITNAGRGYKDYHWIGIIGEVMLFLLIALFLARWTCGIIDELSKRERNPNNRLKSVFSESTKNLEKVD
jgi:hypothetical protein